MLLHHPFQSFQPVMDFIRSAAHDPERGRDQADHLPHRHELGADGVADPGGAARQGSDGDRRTDGALRRGSQHQLGRPARAGRRAGGVRRGRPEDACQAGAGDPARGRRACSCYAHLGTGNYHPTTTKLYTDFGLLTANPAADDRGQRGVHPPDQPDQAQEPAITCGWRRSPCRRKSSRAIRNEAAHRRDGPARAHHRQDECAGRRIGDPRAVRGVERWREDRPDRARRLLAAAGRAGPVGEYPGALDRRPLPRTQPHLSTSATTWRTTSTCPAPTG